LEDLSITPNLTISGSDLEVELSRSGGAGGQHVNKTETRVRLRFKLDACAVLFDEVKERIRKAHPSQVTTEGELLIVCASHRSQHRNLEEARERLAAIIKNALRRPKKRKSTRPSRASKERRLESKRQRSSVKKKRQKVHRGGSD
jgi:ribosome-associated protein